MEKAKRALSSACILLERGDSEGACNRAYYAMFDAARAALIGSGRSAEVAATRTHQGLISAIGLHLVKSGLVENFLGVGFNKVERLRKLADYTGDAVSIEMAAWAVEQAKVFVGAVGCLIDGNPDHS